MTLPGSADDVLIETMPDPAQRRAEFVECKGPGHPDTLCDAIAEAASRALSKHYLERFDRILHHNLDKVLLVGGSSRPRFGGGGLVERIRVVIAGRATTRVGSERIDVDAIARDAGAAALRATLGRIDPLRDVEWECRIRPGSDDLGDLFARGAGARANDTSAGAGFAPLSPLENLVRDVTASLASPSTRPSPACGEDVKIAGMRRDRRYALTVACAAVASQIPDPAAYERFRAAATDAVARQAHARLDADTIDVAVNAADDPARGAYYLTVTGTSAESGDDGETGRGNRVNGLIAPGRPMSMEATAGKNAVSHVGKLYNIAAQQLADAAVSTVGGVRACECILASRIGDPVAKPALVHVRIALAAGADPRMVAPEIDGLARETLSGIDRLWPRVVAGELRLF